jgi:hypothetical protein
MTTSILTRFELRERAEIKTTEILGFLLTRCGGDCDSSQEPHKTYLITNPSELYREPEKSSRKNPPKVSR